MDQDMRSATCVVIVSTISTTYFYITMRGGGTPMEQMTALATGLAASMCIGAAIILIADVEPAVEDDVGIGSFLGAVGWVLGFILIAMGSYIFG